MGAGPCPGLAAGRVRAAVLPGVGRLWPGRRVPAPGRVGLPGADLADGSRLRVVADIGQGDGRPGVLHRLGVLVPIIVAIAVAASNDTTTTYQNAYGLHTMWASVLS